MSDSKLQSFKVADKKALQVSAGSKAAPKAAAEPAPTLGFARIEAILDQENPMQVQQSLAQLTQALEKVGQAGSAKDKGQAKRAKLAVEHTTELLTYLFETKESMLTSLAKATPPTAAAAKGKRPAPRKGGQ